MTITNTIKFSNVGMGISAAGEYVTIAGKPEWVHFLATAEGAGRHTRVTAAKRTWHVSATIGCGEGAVRVTITKRDCNRVDAVAEALAGLVAHVEGDTRAKVLQ